MRLSRKDEHCILALLVLANHDRHKNPVTLVDLAESLKISTSYLEHLLSSLRKHQLVEGLRGVGGGYRLARPATQITLADVLCATEALSQTEATDTVEDGSDTLTLDALQAWQNLSRKIYGFLNDITLADFAPAPKPKAIRRTGESVSNYIATMFLPPSAYGLSATN